MHSVVLATNAELYELQGQLVNGIMVATLYPMSYINFSLIMKTTLDNSYAHFMLFLFFMEI